MQNTAESPWQTHDFKVKMLDWSAVRGSRLAYSCRRCGRRFCRFSVQSAGTWAVDGEGRALEHTVSARWFAEDCPRVTNGKDDQDRMLLRDAVEQ